MLTKNSSICLFNVLYIFRKLSRHDIACGKLWTLNFFMYGIQEIKVQEFYRL